MEKKHLSLPERKNYEVAGEIAYKLACEKLVKIADIEQQCRNSGAQYQVKDSQKIISIRFLNQVYQITLPNIEVLLVDSKEPVPIRDKVLILHYFITAKGTPATNSLIAFRELPEGKVYAPTFAQRTVRPLLNSFGKEPHRLVATGEKLGGQKAEHGDVAITINAFSRVPITIILWQGDDEFPPQGSVVFDSNITDYLPTEDITLICETIAWRLVNLSKESAKSSG